MIWFFTFIHALALFILSILGFIDESVLVSHQNNFLLRNILTLLTKYKLEVAIFCGVYIFLTTVAVWRLKPIKEKRQMIASILSRISTELFDEELELHRVTLFKEIGYFKAIVKHILALGYHLLCYRHKASLYFTRVKKGAYLGVFDRCGLQFLQSTTMLRVEKNDPTKCEGVAGYIRYKKLSLEISNLPDLSDISEKEWLSAKSIREIRKNKRRKVAEYMRQGYMTDFNILKKLHRKARHFYGTIIPKRDGSPWGVLLIDSTSVDSPFNEIIQTRINSFAKTLTAMINMEV